MSKGALRVTIPNPHKGDISKGVLALVLREAEISREESKVYKTSFKTTK